MATTSAANGDFPFQFLPPVTEKLTRGNHAMWLAQVTSTLQGARLWRFTQPSSKSPEEFLPRLPLMMTARRRNLFLIRHMMTGLPRTVKSEATSSHLCQRMCSLKLQVHRRLRNSGLRSKSCRRPDPVQESWPPGWLSPPPKRAPPRWQNTSQR